jgi:hypothetical protein
MSELNGNSLAYWVPKLIEYEAISPGRARQANPNTSDESNPPDSDAAMGSEQSSGKQRRIA